MKKRILIIAAVVILMLSMASCSVPTKTYDAGDVSIELPIHYVPMDDVINSDSVQQLMAEYVPESISVNAHVYASPIDMSLIAIGDVVLSDDVIGENAYDIATEMCDSMGGDAEVVEMGGTFGVKYTIEGIFGDEIPEEIPEDIRDFTIVNLCYMENDGATYVCILCPQDKYDAGCAIDIASSIVVD